jgi:uncharacterized membrane protein YeaQ/YmgE (transglycosylase-associated protein family)
MMEAERTSTSRSNQLLIPQHQVRVDHKESPVAVSGIISALIVGLLIGALGRLVLPGRQRIPIWLTMLVGIVAALVGTLIANALGVGDTGGIDWIELIIQIALAAGGVSLVAGAYGRKTPRS